MGIYIFLTLLIIFSQLIHLSSVLFSDNQTKKMLFVSMVILVLAGMAIFICHISVIYVTSGLASVRGNQ